MSVVEFKRPTREHVEHVARHMRSGDRAEIYATGVPALRGLEFSIEHSDRVSVALIDGTPVAVFGLVIPDVLTGHGHPWMLGTVDIDKNKKLLLVNSRRVVRKMLEICPHLSNQVYTKNHQSIRWLRWLGFTIDNEHPHPETGERFYDFHMRG